MLIQKVTPFGVRKHTDNLFSSKYFTHVFNKFKVAQKNPLKSIEICLQFTNIHKSHVPLM